MVAGTLLGVFTPEVVSLTNLDTLLHTQAIKLQMENGKNVTVYFVKAKF